MGPTRPNGPKWMKGPNMDQINEWAQQGPNKSVSINEWRIVIMIFSMWFAFLCLLPKWVGKLSLMGSGTVPDHSQILLGHCCKHMSFRKRWHRGQRRHICKPYLLSWEKHHLKNWASFGSSGRPAQGKMIVHCASFYNLRDMRGLALTINSNFHDFRCNIGVTFSSKNNKRNWAHRVRLMI